MYPWELGGGTTTPIHSDALPEIHETRLAMLEPAVRSVLEQTEDATVIDLACNEGWFSHRLLEWGASQVVGVDIREVNVRRAQLIAEHHGIGAERLEFRTADIYELDPAEIGEFDVVLLLGLIYHVEDPVRATRLARSLTKRLCVIESQLTRQSEPVAWGRGSGHTELAAASFAAYLEPDAEENPVASASGILSLIPNREAVEQTASAAGFERVDLVEPGARSQRYYGEGDRGLFLAWASNPPAGAELADGSSPAGEPRAPAPAVPGSPNGAERTSLFERISLSRRVRSERKLPSQLREELAADPPWMYPWRIAPGVTAPIHHEMLASVHGTRQEMIEEHVRAALAARTQPEAAGPPDRPPSAPGGVRPRAIDLACNEGWFSHRLLEWGARSVFGVDIREVNIRRARLMAHEFRIEGPQLEFRQSDLFDLRPEQLGKFDVVLFLGLIYHLENPAGAMRLARELTGTLCVIDTQLTRQADPLPWTAQDGVESGSFALQIEKDSVVNPLASAPGRMSLIPNRAAVEEMALAAGFSEVEMLTPPPLSDVQYTSGDRGVFVARVSPPEV